MQRVSRRPSSEVVEVDDIYAVDPKLRADAPAAGVANPPPTHTTMREGDELEIELTAEQIDALLSGGA